MIIGQRARRRLPELVSGVLPIVLLASAYLSSIAIDSVLQIGPFDRAKLGLMITLPLMLLSPGAAALATRRRDDELNWTPLLVTALFVLALVTWRITVTTQQIGCEPVTSWTQVFWRGGMLGIVSAAAFIGASGAAVALGGGILRIVIVGAAAGVVAGMVVLAALVIAFPAVSCAPHAF